MTDWIRRSAVALLALSFLTVPVWSLLVQGPFAWHISQPESWQGGLEALLLFLLFVGALNVRRLPLRAPLMLLGGWIYARRHGVDLSIALIYLYVEAVFAIGWRLLPRFGLRQSARPDRFLAAGLVGLICWSLVLWCVSALGVTEPGIFRFITVAVLGIALLTRTSPPLAIVGFRSLRRADWTTRVFGAFIAAFFLALFAKASVVIDYDSMWYGLQGEEVLLGDAGLFGAQGLVSVVHYYPKLYEVLLLPLSGLGSVSLLFGVGIFSSLAVAATAAAILRELGVSKALRMAGATLVMTLPALANIAVSAKGDAFSAWLILLAILGLLRFQKSRDCVWIWIAVSSLALAVTARLSNIPYAAILAMLLAMSVIRRWPGRRLLDTGGKWFGITSLLLIGLVTARTLLLAGVPFIAPNAVVDLELAVGFKLSYPVGLLPGGQDLPDFPMAQGLLAFLFEPATLPHIIISWPGNVWVWMPLAVVLLMGWRRPWLRGWPLLVLGLSFFLVLFGYKHPVPGGDGNYFIIPIVCLMLWGMTQLSTARSGFLTLAFFAFSLCNAAVAFVTGSWGPGTRAVDANFSRVPLEYSMRADRELALARLKQVNEFFSGKPAGTRVVGLDAVDLNSGVPPEWWLPVRYEPLHAYAWQQPALIRSPENLQNYLRLANIDYVLVSNDRIGGQVESVVRTALAQLMSQGLAQVAHKDDAYTIWELAQATSISLALEGGGSVYMTIPSQELCAGSNNAIAVVGWTTPFPTIAVEVRAKSAQTPSLWIEGGGSGRQATGPWIGRGNELTFRLGRGGKRLGTLRVDPECH